MITDCLQNDFNEFMDTPDSPEADPHPDYNPILTSLLKQSQLPLLQNEFNNINNWRMQAEHRTFFLFTEDKPEIILRRYYELTTITEDESQRLQNLMRQAEKSVDWNSPAVMSMSSSMVNNLMSQSKVSGVRTQAYDNTSFERYKQLLHKINIQKQSIEAKKQITLKLNHDRQLAKQKQQQKLLEEAQNLRKSKLRQKLQFQRMLRLKKEQQRKQQEQAYSEFMKEYKKAKPLHQLKEEQYIEKVHEQSELEYKRHRQRVENLFRPMSISELEEHERKYLEKKKALEQQLTMRRQSLKQTEEKQYYRGRSHEIVMQEEKARLMSLKTKEEKSIDRVRNYYESVLKNIPRPQPKKTIKTIEHEDPPETIDVIVRTKSLGNEYLEYSKKRKKVIKAETTPLIDMDRVPTEIEQNTGGFDKSDGQETIRKPQRPKRPIKIKDRYDVTSLIYENSKKDEMIRRTEQISRYRRHNNTEYSELEERYIDSIKEKLQILSHLY